MRLAFLIFAGLIMAALTFAYFDWAITDFNTVHHALYSWIFFICFCAMSWATVIYGCILLAQGI